MPHEDHELRRMLAAFEVQPPVHLAARIIANATDLPQQRNLLQRFSQAMNEWNYALAYKGMALACFVVLGIISAQTQSETLQLVAPSMDMSSLVMAQGWIEE